MTDHAAVPVIGLDHVSLSVASIDEALAFYVNVLGCVEIPRPSLSFRGAWLRTADGTNIHLIEPPDHRMLTPAPEPTGLTNHVAFRVSSHEEALERLTLLGYDVREGEFGIRQMFVADPSGNTVELLERGTRQPEP